MKTPKDVFEKQLEEAISFYSKDRHIVLEVIKELEEKDILESQTQSIFNLTTPISVLSETMLYVFTKALYNALKKFPYPNMDINHEYHASNFNPELHFTPLQIEEGEKWKNELKEKNDKPLIFNEAIEVYKDLYSTCITIAEIAQHFSASGIYYEPKTQRPLITKFVGDDRIVKRINVNPISVSTIDKRITKKLFIPNTISINVPEKFIAGVQFVKFEGLSNVGKLIIPKGAIIDGFNRLRGAIRAYWRNPNNPDVAGFKFLVRVSLYDVEKANQFIVQEDERNPLDVEFKSSLNIDDSANKIVQYINEKNKYLRGKITTDPTMIKAKQALVMFSDLRDSIDHVFEPDSDQQVLNFQKPISDGLKEIIEQKKELITTPVDGIEWCVYIALIYELFGEDDWKVKLELLASIINMNEFNYKQINSATAKNIRKQVRDLITANSEVLQNV